MPAQVCGENRRNVLRVNKAYACRYAHRAAARNTPQAGEQNQRVGGARMRRSNVARHGARTMQNQTGCQ